MPVYAFQCENGHVEERHLAVEDRDELVGMPCWPCLKSHTNAILYRKFLAPQIAPMVHSHYNPTVGREISSHSQFKSELARKSDEQSARTGIPHDFQPRTPAELKAPE